MKLFRRRMAKQGKVIDIFILNNEYGVTVCYGDYKFVKQVLKDANHKKRKRKNLETDMQESRAITYLSSNAFPVIVLPKYPTTPEEIGILAHEATHAVDEIFKQLDEKVQVNEFFAHSVSAIVRETLIKLK